jgi:hypothetical protein
MAKYIQFKTEDKAISNETVSKGGTVKAGIASTVQSTMENEMILIEVDDDEIVLRGNRQGWSCSRCHTRYNFDCSKAFCRSYKKCHTT